MKTFLAQLAHPRRSGAIARCAPIAAALVASSCLSQGSGVEKHSSSRTVATSGGSAVKALQGLERASWKTDSEGRVNTKLRALSMTGECGRGVNAIRVLSSGAPLGQDAPCSSDSTFSWSHLSLADGEVPIQVVALSRTGAIKEELLSEKLLVDTVPPASPAITTNSGRDLFSIHPTIDLDGLVAADVVSVTTSSPGTLTRANGSANFQFETELAAGQTRAVSFIAYDLAGNASVPAQIQVSYLTELTLSALSPSHADSGAARPVEDSLGTAEGLELSRLTATPWISLAQPTASAPSGLTLRNGAAAISASLEAE